jgi:hypothetical protein
VTRTLALAAACAFALAFAMIGQAAVLAYATPAYVVPW